LGNREQTKRLKRAMNRDATEVIRCQHCGHQQVAQAALISRRSQCDRCGTPLHSCRHCRHFDTKSRFSCRKPIKDAIGDKWAGNECMLFEPRLVLDATGKRAVGSGGKRDAKQIFDSLFKKP
jgi:hypothetical protein